MSHKKIDPKILLNRDGQTQNRRMPEWLPAEKVPVEGRSTEDLWQYVRSMAEELNFFDQSDTVPDGNWRTFFEMDYHTIRGLAAKKSLPPHLALLFSFLELYKEPQLLINQLTKRHLDFYFREVLLLRPTAPVPDKAHVVFELKKNTPSTLLKTGTGLLAGKDETKKELNYRLTHDLVVNQSKVAGLRSVYVNPVNKNYIHYAPVADSKDGLGEPVDPQNPKWNAFGHPELPLAAVGFCFSGEVMRMKEGTRKLTVTLELRNVPALAEIKSNASGLFKISITGEKGWIGPKTITPDFDIKNNETATARFDFELSTDDPPVVDYDAALHGYDFSATAPLLQVLINNQKADMGYHQLNDAEISAVTIDAEVSGIKDLQLENDAGLLNAKKPFFPFGSSPESGANFYVGCDEAFSKRLKKFSISVDWKNIPDSDLGRYFKDYNGNNRNSAFTALATFKDGANWTGYESKQLFDTGNARSTVTLSFNNPSFGFRQPPYFLPLPEIKPVKTIGHSFGKALDTSFRMLQPSVHPVFQLKKNFQFDIAYKILAYFSSARKGFLSLRLNHSFLFKEYRELYSKTVLDFSKKSGTYKDGKYEPPTIDIPNEPFAPEVQSLTFGYTATSGKISLTTASIEDYLNAEIRFYHHGVFGQMREHSYQRSHSGLALPDSIRLLPQYPNEGEFHIGLANLNAEDSVCLLFQTAEGSGNPDKPTVDISWYVLCNNYWKLLGPEDLIFDTTNQLLTSGIIKLVIPKEATAENTWLPPGFLWLKATIPKDSDAVCRLVRVQSNAAIAEFENKDNDPGHLSRPLEEGKINKLAEPVGAMKSVTQPYASFGGRQNESDAAFYTRVSERLRHKERSISLWDYERLVLQHFPQIHKAKCIPHASGTSFYEPGHILMVIIPDLRNRNAINPFQPKADKNTQDKVFDFLCEHSSDWVVHHVANASYVPVKISVGVKLKRGYEFNYYEKEIAGQLQAFLSPWINETEKDIVFNGKITKSMIVQFLENLEYVDYLSDLKMFISPDGGMNFGSDVEVAEAGNPAAILVSHIQHEIINY